MRKKIIKKQFVTVVKKKLTLFSRELIESVLLEFRWFLNWLVGSIFQKRKNIIVLKKYVFQLKPLKTKQKIVETLNSLLYSEWSNSFFCGETSKHI